MTCAEVRDLFGDVADARLAPGELARWNAHRAACAECRLEWASFRHTLDLLHGLPALRAPDGFVRRVMAAARPESRSRRLARRLFLPLRLRLSLEAAALALVAIGGVYLVQRAVPIRTAVQDGAIRSHEPAPPAAPRPGPTAAASPDAASAPTATGAPDTQSAPTGAFTASSPGEPERPRATSRADAQGLALHTRPEDAVPPTSGQARATPETAKVLVPETSPRHSVPTPRAAVAPAVVGRLVVEDPAAAERALGALNARVGATQVGRAVGEDGLVVELEVPHARYAELSRGLADLGRWTPGEERVGSGPALRVRVTVVSPPSR